MNSPIVFRASALNYYYYYLRVFFLMRYLSRNLSFRAIMDLAQKFDGVTCPTNISVSELDVNLKYRILQGRRQTTRFGPTVILTVKNENAAPDQLFLPRRYSDVFLTPTLNKLIQMMYSYISSSNEFVQLLKPICWQ